MQILSCSDFGKYVNNESELYDALAAKNVTPIVRDWRGLNDSHFAIPTLIRTPWDYTENLQDFLTTLSKFDPGKLANSYEVVKWNSNKRYLHQLQSEGISVIPLDIVESSSQIKEIVSKNTCEYVVKPVVGASASGLIRFDRTEVPKIEGEHILQKFLPNITQGEISLIFFDREFEYAIKKVPKKGEIRVQEEYGGILSVIDPEPEHLKWANEALEAIKFPLLYARVDIVPGHGIIEVECIEPSLYFNTFPEGAKRLAAKTLKHFS